ncbi:hypothetical protein V500_09015 [Pseudogymnoascus sp. VKM F-4518 (FW-2643)]|nr:hypothetical protein V500_09015 [Pseudogymnoascus sp. VKM F-4518 (FW-2643)]
MAGRLVTLKPSAEHLKKSPTLFAHPSTRGLLTNPPFAAPLITTNAISDPSEVHTGHITKILKALKTTARRSVLTGPMKSDRRPQRRRPTADDKLNPVTRPVPFDPVRPSELQYKGRKKGGTKQSQKVGRQHSAPKTTASHRAPRGRSALDDLQSERADVLDVSTLRKAYRDRITRSSNSAVYRKNVDDGMLAGDCYICMRCWQIGEEVATLRCECLSWTHKACLAKSVFQTGGSPTCGNSVDLIDDETVLATAAAKGDSEKVRLQLENGIQQSPRDILDLTPLLRTAQHGH